MHPSSGFVPAGRIAPRFLLALLAGAVFPPAAAFGWAKPTADQIPAFSLKVRVTKCGGQPPGDRKFTFRLSQTAAAQSAKGEAWSEPLSFGRAEAEKNLKDYPQLYMHDWPIVVKLSVEGVVDPTLVEAELTFAEGGAPIPLSGDLMGPSLGMLIWRGEDKRPQAQTMAQYNHRYWKELAGVQVAHRPQKFPIVERMINGDDDRRAWREGIEQLNRAGFSAIMLPPDKKLRDILLSVGQKRTAWAVYNPPGYAFDHALKDPRGEIDNWAKEQARPYLDAGYAKGDLAAFALSDEPGWYYPQAFKPLVENPAALARFWEYLRMQSLTPADVGQTRWEDVRPLARSGAKSLAEKRLYYWTCRFFAYDSARHFAESTKALEQEIGPGTPIFTNWNFFSGRFYVPGPVANNDQKTNPDAAMGGHDWFEFGRLRGGTMLWTEDWFADDQAPQWSFYTAKLRSAAAKSKIEFGGYVIPRTAGDRNDGIVQKILCVAGSGGKCIKYFVFGPEYNFPGNCYSEKAGILPYMAKAHEMIGAAEELLWPGRPAKAQVAIVAPRSSQPWDAFDVKIPKQIEDATNNHLNRRTVDYLAETADLYLALQHANIPVDFVDEDDCTPAGLADYRVVYLTQPNLPIENHRGLGEWVKKGGVLVTVSGAAQRDRYDEPCEELGHITGVHERPRSRLLLPEIRSLPEVAKASGPLGKFTVVGIRGNADEAQVEATFADGRAAIIWQTAGEGRHIHFAFMPGMSYQRSYMNVRDKLPIEFSAPLRDYIAWPTRLAKVQPPVAIDRPQIETPVLYCDKGAAITLLNWTGQSAPDLKLTLSLPFEPASIESVSRGKLAFEKTDKKITLTTSLDAADILLVRKKQ